MFTGLQLSSTDHDLIRQMQGVVTESVNDCNILVTDKIRRTTKFLSMVAKGAPIVSVSWLVEAGKFSRFLDPWDFILDDADNEKKWGFKLKETLEKARTKRLLEGIKNHDMQLYPSHVNLTSFHFPQPQILSNYCNFIWFIIISLQDSTSM